MVQKMEFLVGLEKFCANARKGVVMKKICIESEDFFWPGVFRPLKPGSVQLVDRIRKPKWVAYALYESYEFVQHGYETGIATRYQTWLGSDCEWHWLGKVLR